MNLNVEVVVDLVFEILLFTQLTRLFQRAEMKHKINLDLVLTLLLTWMA